MYLEERCPYCDNVEITEEDVEYDYGDGFLVVSQTFTCDACGRAFVLEETYGLESEKIIKHERDEE